MMYRKCCIDNPVSKMLYWRCWIGNVASCISCVVCCMFCAVCCVLRAVFCVLCVVFVVSSFVVSWCCRFTDGLHHQSTKKSTKIHQQSVQNLSKCIPNGSIIYPKSVKMWFCMIWGVLRCRICEKMKSRIKRTPKWTDFGRHFLNKK